MKWQMKFGIKKMQSNAHGKNNFQKTIYSKLVITIQERDLGVLVGSFLQTLPAYSEGNGILGTARQVNE